jgi:hypothetical protein
VTSQRTVFQGSRKTQECRYDKLVGLQPYTDATPARAFWKSIG